MIQMANLRMIFCAQFRLYSYELPPFFPASTGSTFPWANSTQGQHTCKQTSIAILTALSGTTTVTRASGCGVTRSSRSVTPLLSCLMRIDLPLGKLCQVCQYKASKRGGKENSPPVPTRLSGWPSWRRPPCSVGL